MKTKVDPQARLRKLVRSYAAARATAAQKKAIKNLRAEESVDIDALARSVHGAPFEWALPSLFLDLFPRASIKQVGPALRDLLGSKDGTAANNAATAITRYGWVEEFGEDLVRLAARTKDGDASLGALNALRFVSAKSAFKGLLAMGRAKRWTKDWPRGRVIEALAHYGDPRAKSLFRSIVASKTDDEYLLEAAEYGLAVLEKKRGVAKHEFRKRFPGQFMGRTPIDSW